MSCFLVQFGTHPYAMWLTGWQFYILFIGFHLQHESTNHFDHFPLFSHELLICMLQLMCKSKPPYEVRECGNLPTKRELKYWRFLYSTITCIAGRYRLRYTCWWCWYQWQLHDGWSRTICGLWRSHTFLWQDVWKPWF